MMILQSQTVLLVEISTGDLTETQHAAVTWASWGNEEGGLTTCNGVSADDLTARRKSCELHRGQMKAAPKPRRQSVRAEWKVRVGVYRCRDVRPRRAFARPRGVQHFFLVSLSR